MIKVVTVLGTRPEIVRLACVIRRLDEHCEHILVHTGQNYDYELSEVFFHDLELRRPDHFLEADHGSIGRLYGSILARVEPILERETPDAVLVLGDTNSAIAALIAKRLRIPVYHMEAGNRCFDQNVPEEINRRLVDHISDFNLVYTNRAREHLVREGFPSRRIYLTGSPLGEVLARYRERIEAADVLERLELEQGRYILASIHREENVDLAERLAAVLRALEHLAAGLDLPILMSTHPRTRRRLDALGDAGVSLERFRFHEPFGFVDYLKLQTCARCVVSDSGSISEESAILGFPAVTLRDSMERPEAMDEGGIVMAPLEPAEGLLEAVRVQLADHAARRPPIPAEYRIEDASWRVLKVLVGTARVSNAWDGIRPRPQRT
jgi:UDP-N-acetylglucosamine 2-epimerase (non-hydrolysing)